MICAGVLLSGVLSVKDPGLELDKRNNILFQRAKVSYVIPDKYNIKRSSCKGGKILTRNGTNMSGFIRKID